MKIKEYAAQEGVTVQALYQRLKTRGIKPDSLKDQETGELTQDGIIVLDRVFKEKQAPAVERLQTLQDELNKKERHIETLEHEKEILALKLENALKENAILQEAIQHERALAAVLLPAAGETASNTSKQGIFARLRKAFKP